MSLKERIVWDGLTKAHTRALCDLVSGYNARINEINDKTPTLLRTVTFAKHREFGSAKINFTHKVRELDGLFDASVCAASEKMPDRRSWNILGHVYDIHNARRVINHMYRDI